MVEKNGLFGFFKGKGKSFDTVEDAKQREFALSKEQNVNSKVEQKPDITNSDINPEFIDYCKTTLDKILVLSGIEGNTIESRVEDNKLYIDIQNNEEAGRIIGKEGGNLDAYQTILRAIAFKHIDQPIRIILDSNNYRQKRLEQLEAYVLRTAKMAQANNKKIELEPMPADERRFVHMLFEGQDKLKVYSVGEGKERHIVLEP